MLQIILTGSSFLDLQTTTIIISMLFCTSICISYLCFSLWKDIFNHKDINCFYFFNNGNIFFMLNVYSDDHQSTLKYLKDTEVNLWNILIMAGDFNIRNSIWDPFISFICLIVTLFWVLQILWTLNHLILSNRSTFDTWTMPTTWIQL